MKIEQFTDSGNIKIGPFALYVETEGLHGPIAMRLTIDKEGHVAYWEDTMRGHSILIDSYKIHEDKVVLTDQQNREWTFRPLTLELFNSKARSKLSPISTPFHTDEDVQNFYQTTEFLID